MTIKASDLLFCLSANENCIDEGGITVLFTTVEQFAAGMKPNSDEGLMSSEHISHLVQPFWPAGIVMDESMEGAFDISEELTAQEVKDELTNAGFVFSQEFQDEISEEDEEDEEEQIDVEPESSLLDDKEEYADD